MPRRVFIEQLAAVRTSTADALALAGEQLARTVTLLRERDEATATRVIELDTLLDQRHHELHHELLLLFATQQPVASDLRLLAALLQVIRHVERIGDQCVNVAKLVPLADSPPPRGDEVSRCLHEMGERALAEVARAEAALRDNDATIAEELREDDVAVNQLNRSCFIEAVEVAEHVDHRRWAMAMVLVARALERIGDNAVDIADQVAFAATGEWPTDREAA